MNPHVGACEVPVGMWFNSFWEGFRAKSLKNQFLPSGQDKWYFTGQVACKQEKSPFPPHLKQHWLCLLIVPGNRRAMGLPNFYHQFSTTQKGAAQTRRARRLRSYLPRLPVPLVSDLILQCIAQPLASISCLPGQQDISWSHQADWEVLRWQGLNWKGRVQPIRWDSEDRDMKRERKCLDKLPHSQGILSLLQQLAPAPVPLTGPAAPRNLLAPLAAPYSHRGALWQFRHWKWNSLPHWVANAF